MLKHVDVNAFVDWRSQISNAGQKSNRDNNQKALFTSEFVVRSISAFLQKQDIADLYNVDLRIYHGWHRGLTPTENYKGLREIIDDRLIPFSIGNVAFDWSAPFGFNLSDAFDHRKHRRLRLHLPDTLRMDLEDAGREREKMVDTAMVCDILHSARSEPTAWRLIMAEDDDIIPAAFVSEKWSKHQGGRTTILRSRGLSKHVNVDGIVKGFEVYNA